MFDLQYGYITIFVCNVFASEHGQHMTCYRLSNRMTDWTTIRSIGLVDSVFVTCFGADLMPGFAMF